MTLRKFLILSAVALMMAAFSAESAMAAIPSTYFAEGDRIVWRINDVNVCGFPIACAADVSLLCERFNRLYETGFKLTDLNVGQSDGQWSLFIGKNKIFSVSDIHSKSLKQDPVIVALNLLSRMYEVLGAKNAGKLTQAHQIRGNFEVSASVSWYSEKFIGRKFANGERVTRTHLAAAAQSLPFGTLIKVTVPSGRSVVVRITDRFRGHKNRLFDISPAAADILGIRSIGVSKANIKVIGTSDTVGGK
jgi:rare lipoprotein A